MGADQSSTRGSNRPEPAATEKKTCYYELLGVSRTATDDEIKKAYRRKALELHPDRNYGDVEIATKQFAEIQSANEVLSDPQERAWYDSHRDAILNNEAPNEYTQGQNIQVTSASKIVKLMGRFNAGTPFTDAPTGFYGSLRDMFRRLAEEEVAACEWEGLDAVEYPDFGTKEDIDNYKEVVKPFYAAWISFSTSKTFAWKEVHRLSEAPDRYIRRLMEKENRVVRERAVREFNETVRALALFARKRDPRYKPNTLSDAERQKALREASAAQAKRARAANAKKFAEAVVPEWSKSRGEEEVDDEDVFGSEEGEGEEEEDEAVVLRCDFCNKTFKSEQQWEAHEKSKKHTKIVQQVKRQMQKENKKFGLDGSLGSSGVSTPAAAEESEDVDEGEQVELDQGGKELGNGDEISETEKPHEDSDHGIHSDKDQTPSQPQPQPPSDPSSEPSEDEDYAPRTTIADRLTSTHLLPTDDPLASSTASLSILETCTTNQTPTLGKAKVKRAKKLAAAEASATEEHLCGVCGEGFGSKTKLFRHVREEGHAVPLGGVDGGVVGEDEWEERDRKGGRRGKGRGSRLV